MGKAKKSKQSKRNTVSEDRKKSWVRRLCEKAPNVLLVGTLIPLIGGALITYFWGEITKPVYTWNAGRKNIAHEEALAEAKETVGASTVDVIPFRNVDSDQQYIAVITEPPETNIPPKDRNPYSEHQKAYEWLLSEENKCVVYSSVPEARPCYPIKILLKTEGASTAEVVDPGLAAYDFFVDSDNRDVDGKLVDPTSEPEYRNSLLGVADIDGDGNKEVYSMYRSHSGVGTGPYTIKVKLYDSLTGETYELKGSQEVTSTSINPQFTGNRPKEELTTWMNQQAETLNLSNEGNDAQDREWEQMTERERYNKEIRDWNRNNGVGFNEGQIKLEEHKGWIPETAPQRGGSAACSVDDGQFEWVSVFKGPLFSYDKSKGAHYIVWVPKSNYDWASDMISGKKYLWLDVVQDDGLLVLNKETQALEVVPIPELKGWPPGTKHMRMSGRSVRSDGSSLYLQQRPSSGGAVASIIPLTLPDTISAEEEFENAVGCSPKAYKQPNVVK